MRLESLLVLGASAFGVGVPVLQRLQTWRFEVAGSASERHRILGLGFEVCDLIGL